MKFILISVSNNYLLANMFTYKKVPKNRVSYEIVMILYGALFALGQEK